MQTFMPNINGYFFPAALDDVRLRKQLVEVTQIYDANTKRGPAHIFNHPAAIMWRGFDAALLVYGETLAREYYMRWPGTSHICAAELLQLRCESIINTGCVHPFYPTWYYDPIILRQHNALLKYKWKNGKRLSYNSSPANLDAFIAALGTSDPRRVYAKPKALDENGWIGSAYTYDWRD